jgi:hypothetical protein
VESNFRAAFLNDAPTARDYTGRHADSLISAFKGLNAWRINTQGEIVVSVEDYCQIIVEQGMAYVRVYKNAQGEIIWPPLKEFSVDKLKAMCAEQ